jgi:hypothetical protein
MLQTRFQKPTKIVIHHSATTDSGTVSWGAIEDYHVKTNGWSDIGYHAGVEMVSGRPYAMFGRPIWAIAAAVKEEMMNTFGLHVCVVGDYDVQSVPDELLKTLAERVVKPWMNRWSLTVDDIVPHSKYATYKSCPGSKFPMTKLKGLCK